MSSNTDAVKTEPNGTEIKDDELEKTVDDGCRNGTDDEDRKDATIVTADDTDKKCEIIVGEEESRSTNYNATEQDYTSDDVTQQEMNAADVDHTNATDDPELIGDEAYQKLRKANVHPTVATALVRLYEKTSMTSDDIDERALEMLRSFQPDQACFVISGVQEGSMIGVQNKAQYLMALMRNFRDRIRQVGPVAATAEPLIQGPDSTAIKDILDRTGYALEVTVGQRKYGGPPPDWTGSPNGPTAPGHEIYIGHLPKELYEDALIPLFEEVGKIWDLRLMMDPLTGKNRGYAFLTYCDKSSATAAAKKYDGYEIRKGKPLKVNVSIANTRLFLGNIPKSKSKDDILAELRNCADVFAEGVTDVIIYTNPDHTENRKNRGFCFVDFIDHKTASDAKRKLAAGKIRPWNCELVVDWAEQQEEPDDETMSKVKVLYVRHLKEVVTEDQLRAMFSEYGEVERSKKIRDYAFIHYTKRECALQAMEALNGQLVEGTAIEVSLAKPQADRSKSTTRSRGFGAGQWGTRGGSYGRGGAYGGGGRNDPYDDYYPPPPPTRGRGARGMAPAAGPYMGAGGPPRPAVAHDYGYGGGGYDAYSSYNAAYDDYGSMNAAYPGGGYGAPPAYGGSDYGGAYDYYGGGGGGGTYGASVPRGRAPFRGSSTSAAYRGSGGGGGMRGTPAYGGRGGGGGGYAPRGVPRGGGGAGNGRGGRGGGKRPGDGYGAVGGPGAKRSMHDTDGDWSMGGGGSSMDFSSDINMTSF